ncbi:aminotransferase class V-fold PLP-dependent enzyme [candidate division WOR-3 bacterium]|nr:aminotransferase class V-fold PLP-dependent enzyme [candidate division WOR-3 bacterium]
MLEIEKYRELFPVTKNFIHFNHASTGPLSKPAASAIKGLIDNLEKGLYNWEEVGSIVEGTRKLASILLNVSSDEISFIKNTSQGILIAIGSIPWETGDNVVLMKDAFPANIYPWKYNLPDVEKRYVKLGDGKDFVAELSTTIDEHTKAITLDWVHFLSGVKVNLKEVSKLCKKHNTFLIVDAIQGLGALQIDLKKTQVDFLTSGASKWLFGPEGIGILYVSKKTIPKLKPFNIGWLSADWGNFENFTPKPIKSSAARFEEGTRNLIGIVGLRENLKILLEAKLRNVEEKIMNLIDNLTSGFLERGIEILSPFKPQSGIISFRKPKTESQKIFEKLKGEKIICSLRDDWLRFSPHFYNTIEEVNKVMEILS